MTLPHGVYYMKRQRPMDCTIYFVNRLDCLHCGTNFDILFVCLYGDLIDGPVHIKHVILDCVCCASGVYKARKKQIVLTSISAAQPTHLQHWI